MSDVETAQTGATVAPVEVAQTPQIEAQAPTTEQIDSQEDKNDLPRDEKGRFVPQERVNEITRARRQAERERDSYRAELDNLRQKATRQQQNQSVDRPPALQDFTDANEWAAAVASYAEQRAEMRFHERDQRNQQQRAFESFESRAKEYSKTTPDFDDRVSELSSSVQFDPAAIEVIGLSDHGPAIVYYLGQHLDEADRISRLPSHLAAAEFARIEARVSAPKPKPVTKAPDPAPSVGGGVTATKDPDRMTSDEWLEWRNSQLKR